MTNKFNEKYIIKKDNQTATLKTNLEKSEILKIIERIQNNENYSQAYFIEIIEALESELINLHRTCNIEILSDLEVITLS